VVVWRGGRDYACGRVYRFDQIVEAHADMEANRVSGKLVVLT
jgi:NADPH:quinone reductase-like Zn-dependent oxidoreductase